MPLSLRGDRLVLDAGEVGSELRPVAGGGAPAVYLLHDPPLSLFSEIYGATVSFAGGADEPASTFRSDALGFSLMDRISMTFECLGQIRRHCMRDSKCHV